MEQGPGSNHPRPAIFVSWPGYDPDDPETGGRLKAAGLEIRLAPKLGARSEDAVSSLMGDAVGAIVSTDPFTERVIKKNPALRVIARVGVGTDSIDHAAARAARVAITITPGMNAGPVADQTLALILGLLRQVPFQDASVKAGKWERFGAAVPSELAGKTVGIVGAGTIGREVAKRLRGFDAEIVFFDPVAETLESARRLDSLVELLAASDIVTIHAPLTKATRHLINAETIASMKGGALLINTARGPLVEQDAVFAALRSGHLGGAGLDVFAEEPPGAAVLAGVPNLIASAHMGGLSHESIRRMTISASKSVVAVLAGEKPDTVINPEVLA